MNEKNNFKCCTDCNTTKTPLWRGGPAGPKSLCNACGIRYRKRKRVIEGLKKRSEKREDKTTTHGATAAITSASAKIDSSSSNACVNNDLSDSFKMRLMALGKEVLLLKSSPSPSPPPSPPPFQAQYIAQYIVVKKQRCQRRRKLKEEEQAAFSLMALSCGFVFA